VEVVPALLLRMYDKAAEPVFSSAELEALLAFFKTEVNPRHVALYEVLPRRDQGAGLAQMARPSPRGFCGSACSRMKPSTHPAPGLWRTPGAASATA
jgi:hypothetical protein